VSFECNSRWLQEGSVARTLMIVSGSYCGRERWMLWRIFVLLMVLWLLGVTTAHTLGGFIHILLLIAIASVLIRIIQDEEEEDDRRVA
jgi:hypothetical protein